MAFSLVGCQESEEGFADKSEFSVLQALEYDYRDAPHSSRVLIQRNAVGSRLDSIGFPIAGRRSGFVWVLAHTESGNVKVSTEDSFQLSHTELIEVEKHVKLDPKVKKFLEAHAH
jgi:hypothetical protein